MRSAAIVIVAGAALLAGALSAAAGATTYLPDCHDHLRYEPSKIVVFCADGGVQLKRIDWSHWGRAHARGTTHRAFANDCTPNCAEGRFHRYHARVTLRRPIHCARGKTVFSRMRVRFTGAGAPAPITMKPRCPLVETNPL
jgi:hypothetical protein